MNGKVLARQIKQLRPATKVLFMSGYTDNALLHQGLVEAGSALLAKPFTHGSLAQKVRYTLDQKPSAHSVLVVHDKREDRNFIRHTLEQVDIKVFEAETVKQAKEQLRAIPIDLAITSLVMPDGEGLELIGSLRVSTPGIFIIAISDVSERPFLKAAGLLGAETILQRPFQADELLDVVESFFSV
jgi:DNA-binding response OmpR family regulator